MGHIKDPAGIDFVINSRALTKDEEMAISEYIRAYKAKHAHKQLPTKKTAPKQGTTARKKIVV